MDGTLVQVLLPSTAGLTSASLTSVGTASSAIPSVIAPSSTATTLDSIMPTTDIVAEAARAAIHSNTESEEETDDDEEMNQKDGISVLHNQRDNNGQSDMIEIKSEPPPLEAPTQLHPVQLQAHQIQTATLLPAHTIIEMLPQNLIEHQQLLQQHQQQLHQQQQQLQQYQQQLELQQQQDQQQQGQNLQQQQQQQKQQQKGGKVPKNQNNNNNAGKKFYNTQSLCLRISVSMKAVSKWGS